MSRKINTLPYDVLFNIIATMSLEDVVHLGLTCKALTFLLKDPSVCNRLIDVSVHIHHGLRKDALPGSKNFKERLMTPHE